LKNPLHQLEFHLDKKGCVLLIASIFLSILSFFAARSLPTSGASYLLAFIVCFLSSATVLLPVPSWAVVLGMGTKLNPLSLAFFAGLGSALGELTGYGMGAGMKRMAKLRDGREIKKYVRIMKKGAAFWLVLLSFLPNPAFDVAGIAAGIAQVPFYLFFFSVFVGKFLRFLFLLYGFKAFF